MELTPHDIDALLGAWALDAVDDEERAAVEAAVAHDAGLAAATRATRAVAADLALSAERTPPTSLRAAVLGTARAARPPRDVPRVAIPAYEVFVELQAAFSAVLDQVPADAWSRRAEPYAWDLQGLVAHVLAAETYTATFFGAEPLGLDPATERDHLAMSEPVVAAQAALGSAATVAAWRDAAARTRTLAGAASAGELDGGVVFHGWPMARSSVLVVRAFELWTHADDLRRGLGLASVAPSPAALAVMSSLSVNALPLLTTALDRPVPPMRARVRLTGPGGGSWDLVIGAAAPAPASVAEVELEADVVDYCRVVSRRLEPSQLAARTSGAQALVAVLLDAARLIAV